MKTHEVIEEADVVSLDQFRRKKRTARGEPVDPKLSATALSDFRRYNDHASKALGDLHERVANDLKAVTPFGFRSVYEADDWLYDNVDEPGHQYAELDENEKRRIQSIASIAPKAIPKIKQAAERFQGFAQYWRDLEKDGTIGAPVDAIQHAEHARSIHKDMADVFQRALDMIRR